MNRPAARGAIAFRESTTLLQTVFHAVDSGRYVEVGAYADEAHAIGQVFQRAGWIGCHGSVNGASVGALLKRVGQADVHWMKLHSNALAAGMLDDWIDATVLPWVVVLAGTRPIPEWELHLRARGYFLAAADANDRYFVQENRFELAAALADASWHDWDRRLREAQQTAHGQQRYLALADAAKADALAHAHSSQVAMTSLHQQINAIFASSSWRVTKPLRWLSRLKSSPRAALGQLRAYGAAPALRVARKLGRLPAQETTLPPAQFAMQAEPAAPPPPPHQLNLVGPSIQHLLLDAIAHQRPTQELS